MVSQGYDHAGGVEIISPKSKDSISIQKNIKMHKVKSKGCGKKIPEQPLYLFVCKITGSKICFPNI